jgi:hypothetical protein
MEIDLVVTKGPGDQLSGTMSWSGLPEPLRFDGILELMALLERATDPVASERDGMGR